jgi:hypothetical protein
MIPQGSHWVVCLLAIVVAGQSAPAAAQAGGSNRTAPAAKAIPRTADGRPDFQGTWDFRTITPLERLGQFAGKETLTPEEATALEQRTAEGRVDRTPRAGDPGTYNQFWFDFGSTVVGNRRTSLLTDPVDGRLPPLTPDAEKKAADRAATTRQPAAGPEDRPLWERCLLGFNSGPPIMPSGYNNNIQMVQTRSHMVIVTEMVHDARMVPLDGRPHGATRQWMGDSRGRWEGDTLVVDTIHFTKNGTGTIGLRSITDENLHLIERFSLADSDTLLYEFTVSDPTVWTKPWTALIPMRRNPEPIYEYACHEGNIGMQGILAGARQDEKEQK